MSVASDWCLQFSSCSSRVAAHHEQGRGHLVAIGVRSNNVDLVSSFVQLSHGYEATLVVHVDEIAIDAHHGFAECNASDDQGRRGKRACYVVLYGMDASQTQWG